MDVYIIIIYTSGVEEMLSVTSPDNKHTLSYRALAGKRLVQSLLQLSSHAAPPGPIEIVVNV